MRNGLSTGEVIGPDERSCLLALVAAVQALASARSLDDIVAVLRSHAMAAIGSDGVAILLKDGEFGRYVSGDSAARASDNMLPLERCIAGQAFQSTQAIVRSDPDATARLARELGMTTPVRSMAIAPIGKPDAKAALCAYWSWAATVEPSAVNRLESLAGAATTALANGCIHQTLASSERRFRGLFEASPIGVALYNAHTRAIPEVNDRMLELAGMTRAEFERGDWDFVRATPPEGRARDDQAREEIRTTGRIQPYEKSFLHRDGRRVAVLMIATPLDDAGHETIVTAQDLSGMRAAEAALARSEGLIREITETVREVFYIYDLRGPTLVVEYISAAYAEIWERSCESLVAAPLSFVEAIHPEDRSIVEQAMRTQAQGSRTEAEYRILSASGVERWIWDRAYPVRDASGSVVRVIGVAEDITRRKQAEEQLRIVAHELDHRTRNLLTIVQAVVGQALRSAAVSPAVSSAIIDRLNALGAAQGLITSLGWSSTPLAEIVTAAMAPFRAHAARVVAEGPAVSLEPQAGMIVALALHELATNALKYGALSSDTGGVHLQWEERAASGGNEIHLVWREHGGPPVAPPWRRGFGSNLLERGLKRLGGNSTLRFDPAGVIAEIAIQL